MIDYYKVSFMLSSIMWVSWDDFLIPPGIQDVPAFAISCSEMISSRRINKHNQLFLDQKRFINNDPFHRYIFVPVG